MSFLPAPEMNPSYEPFAAFRQHLGFIPNLFRAQTLVPRIIEAEAAIAQAVLLSESRLTRIQKELILLVLAGAHCNRYCVTAHYQMLLGLGESREKLDRALADYRMSGVPPEEEAMLGFALKLGRAGWSISSADVSALASRGLSDEVILEAVHMTALTNFLCTLSTGLGVEPDFAPQLVPPAPPDGPGHVAGESSGPYLRAPARTPEDFPPFAYLREQFGFVPNIFRAQTLRPEVIEAETVVLRAVLLNQELLTRKQKEYMLLVVSAANLNTYCVAVHAEMLRALGVPEEDSDQIAVDHHQARLSAADSALLDFARKLATRPSEYRKEDVDSLRSQGFSDKHILEAMVMIALTSFLNTLQMGLGTTPDFAPLRVFRAAPEQIMHPAASESRLTDEVAASDADADSVERVRKGDLEAFEELVNRHGRRVYRTLVGILGNPEEARDAMQDTFLKAFEHLGDFERRSKFSTWLVSIASNTGIQRMRERRHMESLDEPASDSEGFRPRQVQAWTPDPEQQYTQVEMRRLIEDHVMKLPAKYRVVLMLRDIEEVSTEDAAEALGLGVPALKARLLRGRLMLREALAPHFIPRPAEARTARGLVQ